MTFRRMTKADWDAVIHTNLDSAFNMAKQVHESMMERGWGRIINVSSVDGQRVPSGRPTMRQRRLVCTASLSRWPSS